ncbi:MAG: hypothetical protein VKO00_07055 [Cyanobacteriota bacterium]|nr:hypothetical protein [Cyanobacteriota bacterium]
MAATVADALAAGSSAKTLAIQTKHKSYKTDRWLQKTQGFAVSIHWKLQEGRKGANPVNSNDAAEQIRAIEGQVSAKKGHRHGAQCDVNSSCLVTPSPNALPKLMRAFVSSSTTNGSQP